MTPIKQLKIKLSSIADAIRERTGDDSKLTLDQMVEEIDYMPAGDDGETYILVDEEGNEIPAVLTKEEVDLTATANDIRLGSVAVTDDGVITGEKEIPSYHTHEGMKAIMAGKPFRMVTSDCEYTKLQALVCARGTTLSNSVSTEKVAINSGVYEVYSDQMISTVSVDIEESAIDFGINNDSDSPKIIRFFYYKEEY